MSDTGLVQQGWKDSTDSVFHRDGSGFEADHAKCRATCTPRASRPRGSRACSASPASPRSSARARRAARGVRAGFWSEELSTYVLALDRKKRPCEVRTSNAGHALYTGIASRERALRTAVTLMDERHFSGWGIRTVADSEARYNPMSYHNGSVWPHDNAIIAAGFARYGLREQVRRAFEGMFAASQFVDLHRLPELFCGFPRRPGEGPTLYPIACAPRAGLPAPCS